VREAAAQHARDRGRRVGGVVERCLVARDLAIDRGLRVEALDLMVEQEATTALEISTSGDFSAYAAATGLSVFNAPAP
jgi:hypothetical protein